MTDHNHYMARAISLSRDNIEQGLGGPFGAVIVKDGRIIGEGANHVTSDYDPTAHAEIVAIRAACRSLGDFSLAGAVLYTSCEPCPMCLAASYWARLSRIYYANSAADAAAIGFDDAFLYHEIVQAIPQRSLPMVRLMPNEARTVFAAWEIKADKIPY